MRIRLLRVFAIQSVIGIEAGSLEGLVGSRKSRQRCIGGPTTFTDLISRGRS
jgi:hypothetical protein